MSAPTAAPGTLTRTTAHGAPAEATRTRPGLRGAAARVLLANWTGASTVPSRTLYPHQWSWDSAFIAIGLRHLSPDRAQRELETLCDAQWADGRIPHIVYNPVVPAHSYFPGPGFWHATGAAAPGPTGAPSGLHTSGLVQPPVHALAAWLVHESDPEHAQQRGFLARLYPRLAAWHAYLADHRDLGGHGLASVVHPWEPGMDNSPCWDAPLARIKPVAAGSFQRADLVHGELADRPTDEDYCRYVRIAAHYRDHGYHDGTTPHLFAVEDPAFNSLFAVSEHALAAIAQTLGKSPVPHLARARALTDALLARLWDADTGMFLCRDVVSDTLIKERSVAGLLPLLVPGLPQDTADTLLATLHGPHFGLGTRTTLVPSYDLRGAAYDGSRYWRGPAWFNVNWALERGMRQYGAAQSADRLADQMLNAAGASRFAEYVDPCTGTAHGSTGFSWTAALTLDMLASPVRRG